MFISLVRTIILYLAIILAVRIMGKRQISQLQTSELVVTMLISDLAVIPMQDSGQPLFSGIIPIFVLIALEVMLSFIMLKSGKVRRAICGKPVVIIQDGRLLQENMRELRMSVEDLFEQLRQKDVFALNDIAYAIVETNGMLSVVKKPEVDYLRPVDAGVRPEPDELEVVVVSDGRLSEGSLQLFGKDDAWVRKILKKENTPLKEVFILTVNNTGINIAAEAGAPVKAVFEGEVSVVFFVPGMNNAVMIRHGDYVTVYANLEAVGVKTGDRVALNQTIGKLPADDAFLHFEIWKDQQNLNPELWLRK